MDGKNIADFVDPDILERLLALEAEEEGLVAASAAAAGEAFESDEDAETAALYKTLKTKQDAARRAHSERPAAAAILPRAVKLRHRTAADVEAQLLEKGYDAATAAAASTSARGRKRTRDVDGAAARVMDVDSDDGEEGADAEGAAGGAETSRGRSRAPKRAARSASATAQRAVLAATFGDDAKAVARGVIARSRAPSVKPPQAEGIRDEATRAKLQRKNEKFRSVAFHGTRGEADHTQTNKLPKWLFSGKMGFKRDRR